ncbi:ATP-dependent DNA helicase RecQ [Capnocytophaga sp.]|uniref:RecQ family ATP-dependent DNA helicase n=1 Tax=Capnocytophaga sp. TaxID=44737 RepID=UPI0026DDC893|nr:RecQ family ATP-dependent DNA helicase [Capnocytophaga sp.]MDO5105561.1 RecQ family ATP-dependent DNA helicase [Capnocytophaga sp.]
MNTPLAILKKYWGYDSFREPQTRIVTSVLQGNDTLALMPTGGGKSITFQVPALVKEGICIVVSPLVALMTDQVENLKSRGIKALSIAGGISYADLERLLSNAICGNYKFLYLSPERLHQEVVQSFIKQMNVNLIAIDEAHCVSHWGKDFRPAYLKCKWLKEQFPNVPMLALTASATEKVQNDIVQQLGIEKATVISTSLKRSNIAYMVFKTDAKWQRLEQILKKNQGSSIVYVRSRNATIHLAEYLQERGILATFFHGGLSADEKNKKLSIWLLGDIQVMVATNAFGMGIDKPDVRTVIHWEIPTTIEDYFQEAGRAGRDGQKSYAVLLYDDFDLQNAENQLKEQIIDTQYLKLIYAKLNAYFKIAYGEGAEIPLQFQFSDFCKRYGLHFQKTYNALLMLDRLSVISLSQNFHNKATLQFLPSSYEIINYLKTNADFKDLVFYLLRNFPGIYEQTLPINIEKIAQKTGMDTTKITEQLQKLQQAGIVSYTSESTDAEIVFKVPRDDDRTINSVAKNLKEYTNNKTDLQQAMFRYILDDTICKSVQLLTYFGEKKAEACGICSVCVSKNPSISVDMKEIENKIIALLKQSPQSFTELVLELPFEEKDISECLYNFLDTNVLKINEFNKYVLA